MADLNTCALKIIFTTAFLLGCLLVKSKNGNFQRSEKSDIEDPERHCKPKTRIAFAKTHKTGSSTIQVGKKPCLNPFFSEHYLSLRRSQPASLCASKLWIWPWQAKFCCKSNYTICLQTWKAHIQYVSTIPPRNGWAIQGPQGSFLTSQFGTILFVTFYIFNCRL